MSKPKVLILGGGFAGVTLAANLSAVADITLVDKKDYFEVTPAAHRGLVQPELTDKFLVSLKDATKIGKFIQAEVTSLSSTEATLSNGETLTFDYAAICTGSTYSDSKLKGEVTTAAERKAEIKAASDSLSAASSVLVVGGGVVGVEVAGELATTYPQQVVTLVQPGLELIPATRPWARKSALQTLERKGVKVILNTRVESVEDKQAKLANGDVVQADAVLWCVGIHPNTAFLKQHLGGSLDEKGYVKVNESLQLLSQPNIFALGDTTDIKEVKLAFLAGLHGELVAENIKRLIKGGSTAVLKKWKPGNGMEALVMSIGVDYGIAYFGWLTLPSFLASRIKGPWLPSMLEKFHKVAGTK